MEKILRINVGVQNGNKYTIEPLGDYSGLAGRAMTSTVIAKEVPPKCFPLGEKNKLVFSPGILSGSSAIQAGRFSVGCKSPLTGGIKEANSGGQAPKALARLGYAAIILEGKPTDDTLYKVHINKDGITIIPANDLKMLGNYDLVEKMKKEYGDKITCISIGPVGEMLMPVASVAITDMELRPTRHASRGGVGAVMGAKGVKVIVLDDSGTSPLQPQNKEKFNHYNKRFADGLRKHSVTGEGLPTFGTNVLTNIVNEAGAYPTNNFKFGQFAGASKISGESLANLETSRGGNATQGCCSGCIIRCSGTFLDKEGNFVSKQPEYETIWAHGGNCGIDDLDVIAQLDRLDDDFGIDTIEMGATIGVAMEAGLAKFGDTDAAIELVKEVGKGSHLGRILGSGAAITGKVFGVERVPTVKGQSMPAYDPRAVQGVAVTYATSPMGADHTAGYAVTANLLKVGGDVNALKPEGQIELSRNLQIATAAIDATGYCLFIALAILDQPETFDDMLGVLSAYTGQNLTAEGVTALGKKILSLEKDFNTRAGFTSKDDRLPEFFMNEQFSPHNVRFQIKDSELDNVFNW
ncbi:protein containing Aldehyde ferredoxin oxidoreductase [Candidatus Magnetomorum sp. HK-1]|nr:protein containing Aldehyde ferredoxin oxidoreductase [Candidatus Magnetomorum sp. HK-1]